MKLIVIHGPPASGKHTTGKKLSEITGYKFFYNHLTVDVVRSLFEDEDKRRHELLMNLRLEVIENAARYDMDTVFTMAYTQESHSEEFVRKMLNIIRENNSTAHFVRLDPPNETLFKRIGNQSRHILRKPTDPKYLKKFLATRNTRVTLDPDGLVLDTSKFLPDESAAQIVEYFGL